jgi:hypothetical protein
VVDEVVLEGFQLQAWELVVRVMMVAEAEEFQGLV